MPGPRAIGSLAWLDLTVEDARSVLPFYREVVGWDPDPVSMGDYDDYGLSTPDTGEPVAGLCHARGVNAELPPVWLPYVRVADLTHSLERCRAHGGSVVAGPKGLGPDQQYAVVRDPAGAHLALFEEKA